jgi:hypothetical protein
MRLGSYLITLSALASTFGGMVKPICLAVLRLITRPIDQETANLHKIIPEVVSQVSGSRTHAP